MRDGTFNYTVPLTALSQRCEVFTPAFEKFYISAWRVTNGRQTFPNSSIFQKKKYTRMFRTFLQETLPDRLLKSPFSITAQTCCKLREMKGKYLIKTGKITFHLFNRSVLIRWANIVTNTVHNMCQYCHSIDKMNQHFHRIETNRIKLIRDH